MADVLDFLHDRLSLPHDRQPALAELANHRLPGGLVLGTLHWPRKPRLGCSRGDRSQVSQVVDA